MKNKDRYTLSLPQKWRKLEDQNYVCANPLCNAVLLKPSDAVFDHRIPIWKRPPGQKRWTPEEEYEGQDGLCADCNRVKTAKEASERAHHERLENVAQGKPKRQRDKFKRKIQNPGFDKRHKKDWKTGRAIRRQ